MKGAKEAVRANSGGERYLFRTLWLLVRRTIGKFVPPPRKRKLRVLDLTQLGDKRFVAVVRCGRETFLIGGSANSVALLTRLAAPNARSSTGVQIETRERFVS